MALTRTSKSVYFFFRSMDSIEGHSFRGDLESLQWIGEP